MQVEWFRGWPLNFAAPVDDHHESAGPVGARRPSPNGSKPTEAQDRDFSPIVPVDDDALATYARAHRVAAE